jgi:hypothetical protein
MCDLTRRGGIINLTRARPGRRNSSCSAETKKPATSKNIGRSLWPFYQKPIPREPASPETVSEKGLRIIRPLSPLSFLPKAATVHSNRTATIHGAWRSTVVFGPIAKSATGKIQKFRLRELAKDVERVS